MNKKVIFSISILLLFTFYILKVKDISNHLPSGSYSIERIYCASDTDNNKTLLERYDKNDDVELVASYSLDFDNVVSKKIEIDSRRALLTLNTEDCSSSVSLPLLSNQGGFIRLDFGKEVAYERDKQCVFLKTTHGKLRRFNEEGDFYSRSEFLTEYWPLEGDRLVSASIENQSDTYFLSFLNERRKYISCDVIVWKLKRMSQDL